MRECRAYLLELATAIYYYIILVDREQWTQIIT